MKISQFFKEGIRTDIERVARANVDSKLIDKNIARTRILDTYTLFVDPNDESLGKDIYHDGFWEIWITQFFIRNVKPGWKVLDIGANFGYYSIIFSDLVGNSGRVWAFEPNPYLVDFINMSIEENKMTNVSVIQKALSNFSGEAQLKFPKTLLGNASIKYGFDGYDESSISVGVERLDDFNFDRIDLIKIDAEGSEPDIIDGAQEMMRKNPNMKICLEWLPERFEDRGNFLKILDNDYLIYRIATSGRVGIRTSVDFLMSGAVGWDMLYLVPK